MLTGWPPWEDNNKMTLYEKILKLPVDLTHENLSPASKDLLRKMLEKNVADRITVDKIKKHPFFAGIDWSKLLMKTGKAPYIPHITSETDTSHFDPEFTREDPM